MNLYPYQQQAAEHLAGILSRDKTCYGLDASDTGTGKTYTALAACRMAGFRPLVVCPKGVIPSWHRVAEFLGVDPVDVLNYEKIIRGNTQWLKSAKRQFAWQVPMDVAIIMDEAHRCGGYDTLNSKMCAQTKAYRIPTLLLSATLADSPLKMKAAGYLFGLHNYRDSMRWMLNNGCYRNTWGGLSPGTGAQVKDVMRRLNAHLFPDYGVRVRIVDLPDFPETQITAELYQVAKPREIDKIYEEMSARLMDAAGNKLVVQLRARQQVEYLKVPVFRELALDFMDEGMSVVVFVSFRETLTQLRHHFPDASIIHGEQTDRQQNIDRFQADETRIILCTISAGGTGLSLHDLRGHHPRVALISPTFNAVELKQALGRVHRAGALSKSLQRLVFAADTVEEQIAAAVSRKLGNLSLLNDGDLTVPFEL
jgi:superfamily II DNA or RNA helicase